MNNHITTSITVPRSVFLEGHAECQRCQAHVRPSTTTSAFVRLAQASMASAWCTVCCSTTSYILQPRVSPTKLC